MRSKLMTTMLALALGTFQLISATSAKAADTTVTCKKPIVSVNTGVGGNSLSPRFTIACTGGSSAGNIIYFAYQISANPTVAALLMQTFETWVLQDDGGGSITIQSDFEDSSGPAWGCGFANCRIIDFLQTN